MSIVAKPIVRHLIVIGLGLIGGSLASAARKRGVCEKVIGVARREDVCTKAVELGVADEATVSLASIAPSLGEGDVIFIAVPTLTVARILDEVHANVSSAVTITDGASVKGSVLADVQRIWGQAPPNVVLGHPIAGSEKSGVEAANPELYENHRVILTPTPETGCDHLQRVDALWRAVGGEVLHLDVQQHDDILAATSHLPHVIAYSLVDTLAHDSQNQDIFRYAAGGFKDFTRIASSDATMWRDIMLANKKAILDSIDLFSANLDHLRTAILEANGGELMNVFSRAKGARDQFIQNFSANTSAQTAGEKNLITYRIKKSNPLTGELVLPGNSLTLFFIAAALMTPGSDLLLRHACVDAPCAAAIELLQSMGGSIQLSPVPALSSKPVVDIRVRHSALRGAVAPKTLVAKLSLELPLICVMTAVTEGAVELAGAIDVAPSTSLAMLDVLNSLGVKARQLEATLHIEGQNITASELSLDVRESILSECKSSIELALILAGLSCEKGLTITHCTNIDTLYPGFVSLIQGAGISLDVFSS